ncbi:MAG TPA: amidase [Nocardioidaceae bacterium]|nr:amidase [Nocardioidaceae bacterium]
MSTPPDTEERNRYASGMRRGLDVAADLADEEPGQPGWPQHEPSFGPPETRPVWARRPTRSVADALGAGWLVTREPPGSTTGAHTTQAGPLAGLSVAVKDIIDVAGLPTRNGTPGALWREPTESAKAWHRLAEAGAQCIGKAATHEMAWGVTTPQIAHPTHPDHITGGSSGGSAACVAAGVSHAGLGTDTNGSVRIPAALCGIVGFRPTTGSTELTGVTPLAPEQDVVGPMTADVSTCAAMLEVLLDRSLRRVPDHVETLSGLRIGVLTRTGRLDPAVAEAYLDTLTALEREGAEIISCDTPLPGLSDHISLVAMLISSAALHAAAVHADPTSFGDRARAPLTVGEDLTPADASAVDQARDTLTVRTARLFSDERLDAFLTPTTPCPAPLRGADTVQIADKEYSVSDALTRFMAWAPVTGMPAVSVPVPVRGLPVGMQVMAPAHRDDTCIRVALSIEQLT